MTSAFSRWLLARLHAPASARALHRAALAASHAGEQAASLRLFARAARVYRRDLDVRGLAALRIHEGLARLRTVRGAEAAALAAEVERRLARFDEIESPVPPFAPVPAHELAAMLPHVPESVGRAA
jgi:hypothetical protein